MSLPCPFELFQSLYDITHWASSSKLQIHCGRSIQSLISHARCHYWGGRFSGNPLPELALQCSELLPWIFRAQRYGDDRDASCTQLCAKQF